MPLPRVLPCVDGAHVSAPTPQYRNRIERDSFRWLSSLGGAPYENMHMPTRSLGGWSSAGHGGLQRGIDHHSGGLGGRTMPLPPCGHIVAVCEIRSVRDQPLNELSVRTPTGRLIVVTLRSACHSGLAQRLVMSQL